MHFSLNFFSRIVIIILLLFSFQIPARCYPIPEMRAVWLDAGALPTFQDEAEALIDKYAKANINAVFPEVVCRGYTVYPSRLIGRDPRFAGKPDPLQLLIDCCQKKGIEVHPWVWVFRAGYTKDRGWILTNHPDWTEVDRFGDDLSGNGGLWISPAVPEARAFLLDLFSELGRKYNIDGIHLDYVRYESQTPVPYGYNPVSMAGFSQVFSLDPAALDRMNPAWLDWRMYREELVNTFVHSVALQLRYIKPSLKISAAIAPDISVARAYFLQNWRHWVNNRWVDFVAPMAYFTDNNKFERYTKIAVNAVENKTPVVAGIGLHLMKAAPNLAVEQTLLGRELGCFGQALFAGSYLTDEILELLGNGPYSKASTRLLLDVEDNALRLAESASKSMDSTLALASQKYTSYLEYQTRDLQFVLPMRVENNIPQIVLPIPTLRARKTATPVNVDGKLDEECWQNASIQQIKHSADGDEFDDNTRFMACWDSDALYVAFVVKNIDEKTLVSKTTKRDGPVFYDDSVELFIDPEGAQRRYFHLSCNCSAVQFDQYIDKSMDVGWNADWQCAVSIADNTWVTEISIPFSALKRPTPTVGSKWSINFTRNTFRDSKPVYLNWSVVYGSFHNPDRFGTIFFD